MTNRNTKLREKMKQFEIIIFSNNKSILNNFKEIKLNPGYNLHIWPIKNLYSNEFLQSNNCFYYLDISGFNKKSFISAMKKVYKKKLKFWGIIDPESLIADPVKILLNGASDYINAQLLKRGINPLRLNKLTNITKETFKYKDEESGFKVIPSPKSWEDIQTGLEYTFCLMFIEIDNQDKIKSKMGDQQLEQAYNSFRSFIEKIVDTANGKLWIWNTGGGIVLFPFNESLTNPVIIGIRLILSRKLISIEHLCFGFPISYRIVFHLGNTVYMPRGKTGTIISDDINSLFHIGKRFVKSGKLYISDRLIDYLHRGITNKLKLYGESENLKIYSFEI